MLKMTALEPNPFCCGHLRASTTQFALLAGAQRKRTLLQWHGMRSDEAAPPKNYTDASGFLCSYFRREFMGLSTIPLLFSLRESLQGLAANALEVDGGEQLVIREEVRKVITKAKAPGMLRLVFHDAGTFEMDESTGGMNGSIIYELDRPENAGLSKSMKVLEKAKSELDEMQPVSWADMIAVAGAEAVLLCGGPAIPVQLGRTDSMSPDPEGKLPSETLDAPSQKKYFQRIGFSRYQREEMVEQKLSS